ncbi:hypothetical protein COO60DRAFT_1578278 [Scenedesmus sp. NREL 46B-D3]|nr:hypothetical protein COO60DRAFT_1578278 [Scenedesmus sp. NREL 46B-D3]
MLLWHANMQRSLMLCMATAHRSRRATCRGAVPHTAHSACLETFQSSNTKDTDSNQNLPNPQDTQRDLCCAVRSATKHASCMWTACTAHHTPSSWGALGCVTVSNAHGCSNHAC